MTFFKTARGRAAPDGREEKDVRSRRVSSTNACKGRRSRRSEICSCNLPCEALYIYIYLFKFKINYKCSFHSRYSLYSASRHSSPVPVTQHQIMSLCSCLCTSFYICLPALFLSMTVECADLFTPKSIKGCCHVFHYTLLQILTLLQHLQFSV